MQEARWHDGKPVTPDDVIFSFDAFKKNSPMYSAYYRHVVKCEKVGEREVKFTFDGPGNRELPSDRRRSSRYCRSIGGKAPTRKGASATSPRPRWRFRWDLRPYRIKEFVAGRSLVLERVKDYWGKNLPHSIGQNNFDEIRFEFFRDDTVGARGLQGRSARLDCRAQRQAMVDGL